MDSFEMVPDNYRPPAKGDIVRIQFVDGSEPERLFLVMDTATDGTTQMLDMLGDPENPVCADAAPSGG